MNPTISLPRHNSMASNFGGVSSSRRDTSVRMPRFFKRLFKFPQMDFEMAVWEMTSLIIAPKKVFRSIYYHVRPAIYPLPLLACDQVSRMGTRHKLTMSHRNVSLLHSTCTLTSADLTRNEKHLASSRSLVHLPPLFLPRPDGLGMGPRIRRRRVTNITDNPSLCLRPLSRNIPTCIDRDVLSGRQISRTGRGRMAGQEEARAVWTAGKSTSRAVGVWILL